MTTRLARHPDDDADLVVCWNATAKFEGLCIVGDKRRTVTEVGKLFAGQDVMVHENNQGVIDSAMSFYWENHVEPSFGAGLVIPERMEQSTPIVQGELVVAIFQFFIDKGFETSRLETPPKVMLTLPFIGQLDGEIVDIPQDEDGTANFYHYRFVNVVAIRRMKEYLARGPIKIVM